MQSFGWLAGIAGGTSGLIVGLVVFLPFRFFGAVPLYFFVGLVFGWFFVFELGVCLGCGWIRLFEAW